MSAELGTHTAHRELPGMVPLQTEREADDPAMAAAWAETAKEWRGKGPNLRDELIKALQKTSGAVSWQTLTTLVAHDTSRRQWA